MMGQKATQRDRNVLFERLWYEHLNDDKVDGSKYQKIAEQMTTELGYTVTESALKHLRERLKLPGIYRKAAEKQACYDHDIEGQPRVPDGDLLGPSRIPRYLVKRQLRADQEQKMAPKQTRARRATSSAVPQYYVQHSIQLSQKIGNRRRRSTTDRNTELPDAVASLQPGKGVGTVPLSRMRSTNDNVSRSLQPEEWTETSEHVIMDELGTSTLGDSLNDGEFALLGPGVGPLGNDLNQNHYVWEGELALYDSIWNAADATELLTTSDQSAPGASLMGQPMSETSGAADSSTPADSINVEIEEIQRLCGFEHDVSYADMSVDLIPATNGSYFDPHSFVVLLPETMFRAAEDFARGLVSRGSDTVLVEGCIGSFNGALTSKQSWYLQSWWSYARLYNAKEMLELGILNLADGYIKKSIAHMLKALPDPTARVLSDIMLIGFTCLTSGSDLTRARLRRAITIITTKAEEIGVARRYKSLLTILGALAQFEPNDIETKLHITSSFLDIMTRIMQHNVQHNFDAVYEMREQLTTLLMQAGRIEEAKEACIKLISLAQLHRTRHSDDVYRARRLWARILLKADDYSGARPALLSINEDHKANEHIFRQSAAKKEWAIWEDLKQIAVIEGDDALERRYYRLAIEASIRNYGENSANTIRILNDYCQSLVKRRLWLDVQNVLTNYPNAAKAFASGA